MIHEIYTPETRWLCQLVRRLVYGDLREAVVNEIEKLTNTGIARPSNSP